MHMLIVTQADHALLMMLRPHADLQRELHRAIVVSSEAVPASAWVFRGWLSWMEVVVALVGIASMAVAVQGFVRRRPRLLQAARPGKRHTVCPLSGEPLTEGA